MQLLDKLQNKYQTLVEPEHDLVYICEKCGEQKNSIAILHAHMEEHFGLFESLRDAFTPLSLMPWNETKFSKMRRWTSVKIKETGERLSLGEAEKREDLELVW